MVDSDEEYNSSSRHHSSGGGGGHGGSASNANYNNRKSHHRDKFHRERDDGGGGGGGGRRDWNDERNRGLDSTSMPTSTGGGSWKSSSSGGGNRVGNYQRSNDYSRKYYDAASPPNKRRKDWDNHGGGYGAQHSADFTSPGSYKYHQSSGQNYQQAEPDYPTQPPLLSFKQFLQQQDDTISDEDAIRKYNEYKIDFKRTQINNFFLEHKEEDWFKSKYHPDENYKRRNEQNQNVINRCDVFMDLMNKGWLNDEIATEYDKANELIRFLDAVVIKLEGGTDQDVKNLLDGNPDVVEITKPTENELKKEPREVDEVELDGENSHKTNGAKKSETNGEYHEDESKEEGEEENKNESGSESGAYTDDSESDQDNDDDDDDKKAKKRKRRSSESKKKKSSADKSQSGGENEPPKKRLLHKTTSIFMRNLAPSVTKQDLEQVAKNYDGFKRVSLSDPAPERGFLRRGWITFESYVDVKKICWNLQNIKIKECNPGAIVNRELTNRIRAIPNLVAHHKPVVKNDIKLAMKIIQCMDKRWNLWQPADETTTSAIELSSNATTGASTTATVSAGEAINTNGNSTAASTDVNGGNKNESAVATDNKDTTTTTTGTAETDYAKLEEAAFGKLVSSECPPIKHRFHGTNPLLVNITDYLVDEASAEEEELLGQPGTKPAQSKSTNEIEFDRAYTRILDKLILYLRVVHSIDFYNAIEYQQEDSMPNRCGIMFVRPSLPLNAASASLRVTQDDVQSYMKQFEAKLKPFLEFKERLEVEQAKKLGIKDQRDEIEKFIKVNTQELAPDRWLCPLSGKRFKGPEFIRKHIFYKHMEKIVEVKKEVEYFNNYVFDPKRPQLPEHPSNRPGGSGTGGSASGQSTSGSGPNSSNTSSMSNQYQSHLGGSGGGGVYGSSGGFNQPYLNNGPGLLGSQPAMMTPQQFGHAMVNAAARLTGGGWSAPASSYGGDIAAAYGSTGFMQPQFGVAMTGGGGFGAMSHGSSGGGYRQGGGRGGYGGGGYNRRGGGNREMIQYKDLDAPEDT